MADDFNDKGKIMNVVFLIIGIFLLLGCVPKDMIPKNEGEPPSLCMEFKATDTDGLSDTYVANRAFWRTFNAHYSRKNAISDSDDHRKLVVFMDGTGNDKSSSTNVRKLYRLAVQHACSGKRIIPYYDKGVGAKWIDRVTGGIGGRGTSLNIRQAYRFLVETYLPGDEIYIIGFSRGAFTARSLNGLIEFAGLVDRGSIPKKWYDTFEWIGATNLHFSIGALYDVYHQDFDGTAEFEERIRGELRALMEHRGMTAYQDKHKVKITAIGVFDTVPALGLIRDDEPDDHRVELYADNGFHALALDEQRDDFRLLRFDPLRAIPGSRLEEVWFAGVHSDVGGSYSLEYNCTSKDNFNGLATTPLNWMLKKFSTFDIFPPTDELIKLADQEKNGFLQCGCAHEANPFIECNCGLLHDEFFDGGFGLFQNMGTFPRRPHPGDSIHKSVPQRIKSAKIFKPHARREAGGRYLFLGRATSGSIDEFFEKHFKVGE